MSGEVKYKDVVYKGENDQIEYIWCEYKARLHTVIPPKVRYQVVAYEAILDLTSGTQQFRRDSKLAESSFKKTPKEARNIVEGTVGLLKKENIVFEESFGTSLRIIDEVF